MKDADSSRGSSPDKIDGDGLDTPKKKKLVLTPNGSTDKKPYITDRENEIQIVVDLEDGS